MSIKTLLGLVTAIQKGQREREREGDLAQKGEQHWVGRAWPINWNLSTR